MTTNNKHGALAQLETSIKNSADLENNRYKNDAALRSPHEDDAALFDDIGDSVSAPGQRPRGLGANLAAGISKGLAHGSRTQATAEKKGKHDKYAKQTAYLQNVQAQTQKMNQWHAEEEQRMETVKPFAVGGLEVAYSGMDYATGNERMRNIIEQAKIADPRIKGDYIGYVPNSPIVNLRTQDGEIIAYSLSNLVGEDVVNRVQKNYIEQQKLNTSQDNVEVTKYGKGIPGKYESQGDGFGADNKFEYNGEDFDVVPLRGMTSTEKSDYGKGVNKAVLNIPVNERAIQSVNDMRAVFQRNPNIGESWVNMLSSGDDEDTWGRYIAKKFTSRQELADMQLLKKASADLNLSTVLSVPGKSATDLLKQAINASSPTGFLTKKAFDQVANSWEERAMSNITYAQAQAQARAQGKMIISKMAKSQNSSNTNGAAKGGDSPLAAFGKRVN